MKKRILKKQVRGVAMLLVVVVISSATLIMSLGSALLGIGEADSGYTYTKGGEAFSIADGCMEEALERMRVNNAYAGGSVPATNGSCTISISGSGVNRTITSFGSTIDSYNKKIQATITLIPASRSLVVNTWQEVTN